MRSEACMTYACQEEGYNVEERQTKAVYKERRKNRDATGDTAGRGTSGIKRIAKEEEEERKAKRGKRGPS